MLQMAPVLRELETIVNNTMAERQANESASQLFAMGIQQTGQLFRHEAESELHSAYKGLVNGTDYGGHSLTKTPAGKSFFGHIWSIIASFFLLKPLIDGMPPPTGPRNIFITVNLYLIGICCPGGVLANVCDTIEKHKKAIAKCFGDTKRCCGGLYACCARKDGKPPSCKEFIKIFGGCLKTCCCQVVPLLNDDAGKVHKVVEAERT
jgi:hypothetical protein